MGIYKDITGQKFGKLTVLKLDHTEQRFLKNKPTVKNGLMYFYLCECECGNKIIVNKDNLIKNNTKSCGCLKHLSYHISHNQSKTRLYNIYIKMKARCLNANNPAYVNYGGRGIKICKEWQDNYINFYNWAMSNGYNENLTIDRINNNGDYEPSNCRWVDRKIQANNTRRNHFLTYNNKTHTLAEWSKLLKINYNTLKGRLVTGHPIEQILHVGRLSYS